MCWTLAYLPNTSKLHRATAPSAPSCPAADFSENRNMGTYRRPHLDKPNTPDCATPPVLHLDNLATVFHLDDLATKPHDLLMFWAQIYSPQNYKTSTLVDVVAAVLHLEGCVV
jgi:hypothetical protein